MKTALPHYRLPPIATATVTGNVWLGWSCNPDITSPDGGINALSGLQIAIPRPDKRSAIRHCFCRQSHKAHFVNNVNQILMQY
ncbi:hypothetical protein EVY00_15495 [Citrobacter werkmanii]|nr:hypothetical protein EVY00_15495 [Citrobacter werkmanii]